MYAFAKTISSPAVLHGGSRSFPRPISFFTSNSLETTVERQALLPVSRSVLVSRSIHTSSISKFITSPAVLCGGLGTRGLTRPVSVSNRLETTVGTQALLPVGQSVVHSRSVCRDIEREREPVQADHQAWAMYISPRHHRALMWHRALMSGQSAPPVEQIDHFNLIDSKWCRFSPSAALQRAMKESQYQQIYHSVAIEGSTLTLTQVTDIIKTRHAVPGHSLREQNEPIGVDEAMKYMKSSILPSRSCRAGVISLTDILEIHRRVFGYVDPVEAGRLRSVQVYVGPHVPPPAQDVGPHMQQLLQWLNGEEARQLHPVERAALAHYGLAHVHPFVDGNGRTARLLMNLVLMQAAYPPVIVRVEQSPEYYKALKTANGGDVTPFIRFIANCTEDTLDTLQDLLDQDTYRTHY